MDTTNTGCVEIHAVLSDGSRAWYWVGVDRTLAYSAAINAAQNRLTRWLGFTPGVGSSYRMSNHEPCLSSILD